MRARDIVTFEVCKKLFVKARTPQQLLAISIPELEQMIYPLGFYKRKAALLHSVSEDIITRFKGKVPGNEKDLLSIKGVGLKTANLVLGEGFDIPAICVDTHVHKIANRLGWVKTKTPEQTEAALKKIVPQRYWIKLNHLFVMWGQNICVPISPFCSKCAISSLCPRIGVTRSR